MLDKNGILVIDVPNEYNILQVTVKNYTIYLNGGLLMHLNYFHLLNNIFSETGYEMFHCESSFPLEMFLLFGENYVSDPKVGKEIHNKRVNFEMNLVKAAFKNIIRFVP